jgi:hypothetical protein
MWYYVMWYFAVWHFAVEHFVASHDMLCQRSGLGSTGRLDHCSVAGDLR